MFEYILHHQAGKATSDEQHKKSQENRLHAVEALWGYYREEAHGVMMKYEGFFSLSHSMRIEQIYLHIATPKLSEHKMPVNSFTRCARSGEIFEFIIVFCVLAIA